MHLRKETKIALRNLRLIVLQQSTKIKVKLKNRKESETQSMMATSVLNVDAKTISEEKFLNNFMIELPYLLKSEDVLWTL
jgi:hypothetical protein|nr:hypothetical protein [uncultured Emticicia sp.]